ncbi:MAG: DUF3108 domain-containing protein [Paludibacteraceae bacterium]|nr:DUF3108 domain-containing protein [Paludibacteraceae bacterium]
MILSQFIKKLGFLLVSLFMFFPLTAQIHANEKLVYSGSYFLSGMMTNVAQITMSTEMLKTSKKSYLHLSVEAATFQKWDSYFKIRDLYESYVDPQSLKPSLYQRNVYEGGYTKTEKYTFLPDGKTVKSVTRRKNGPVKTNSVSINPKTIDVVTLIYKLRTINFSTIRPGQFIAFQTIFDEKEYPVWIKFIGKETISTSILGKQACFKLSISSKTNKLKGTDKNLIWITADSKKIPCLIEFSIPVGTGRVSLINVSGI